MKKIIGGLLACACTSFAFPAIAVKTIVINRVSDIQAVAFNVGKSTIEIQAPSIVKVAGHDILEGTLWFHGGHVRALDSATFYVRGWMNFTAGYPTRSPITDVQFLNEKGEAFGRTKHEGYYADLGSIGSYAPDETGPFDVYGVKFRVEFQGIVMGWALEELNLDTSSWTLNDVSYAPGEALAAAVPEPSSWAMMVLGFGGLVMRRRRRAGGAIVLA